VIQNTAASSRRSISSEKHGPSEDILMKSFGKEQAVTVGGVGRFLHIYHHNLSQRKFIFEGNNCVNRCMNFDGSIKNIQMDMAHL
jgi:hypothetical protein